MKTLICAWALTAKPNNALQLGNMREGAVQWSDDLIGFDSNIAAPLPDNGPTRATRTDKTNGDSNQWHCDSFLSACAPH